MSRRAGYAGFRLRVGTFRDGRRGAPPLGWCDEAGTPVRALRALAAGLLGVAFVLGSALIGSTAAAAAGPESWVAITFTGMSPTLPQRDGDVTLEGKVTNTSKVPLSNLQAIFWRSFDPIQDSEGMQAALVSRADEPLGARTADVYQNIPTEDDRTLAPKESAQFSLTIPVSALQLPSIDAIYLLGIHVRGRLEPVGPDITLGRGRVFAPIVSTPPRSAAQLSTLVVLESRPSLVRKGVLHDDHLAAEIAPNGRLTALLDAAEVEQTSFAVDPELIEELQTMRSGYRVLNGDGSTEPGTGQSAAARWLADYTEMAADQNGYRLLYGHPDVAALVHADLTPVIAGAQSAAKAITTTSALPLLAMPVAGQADQQTVDALAELSPKAIVLDNSTTEQSRPLLEGPRGIPLLNTATRTFGGGPGPDPQNTAVQIRQRALSETWLEASAAGPDDTIGQLRVVRSREQARGNGREVEAPWLRREPLNRLLTSTPARWAEHYHYPQSAVEAELNDVQIGGIRRLISSYRTVADLLVRPSDVEMEADATAARSASWSWRNKLEDWLTFVTPQQQAIDDQRNAVQIIATPKVVTSAHNVQFPVTVRNTLPASADDPLRNAIRVRLEFVSANGQRLTVTPSPDMAKMQVPAHAGVTSNAQVHARSNGTVRVTVHAYTLDGRPVGKPVPIDVQATQAGTIGWFIAIAAGIVLIGGSALRIRQVTKERAGPPDQVTPAAQHHDAAPVESHRAHVVPPSPATGRGDPPRNPESLDV